MRSLIFNIFYFGGTFLFAFVLAIIALFPGQKVMRAVFRMHSVYIVGITRWILWTKVEWRGMERFADGSKPGLVVCKHQSELDPFMLFYHYPDTAAIAMQQLENYPFIGRVIRKLGYIIVDVEGSKTNQLRDVMVGSRKVAEEGRPILIYPEGELMRVGSRHRYKTGVFHIYQATGLPATPVALCCGLAWPQRKWTKRAGQTVVMEFLEPIPPGLDKDTFMAEIERRIEEGTMALIREHGDPETVAIAEERYAKGLTNKDDVTVDMLNSLRSESDAAA